MFGGYADVAAYYYDTGLQPAALQEGEIDLPEEYHPVWRMPDPWHSDSPCKADFILIGECSEMEGPKPLITIPKHSGGDFDLDDFASRIMSVDNGQSQPSASFRIQSDTNVVISDAKRKVYAYIHNICLCDVTARGYVRPFCIAYVTPDDAKLQCFHNDIQDEIKQVSQTWKQANLWVFLNDMTHHLSDLQYTRERFLEKQAAMNSVPNAEMPEQRESCEDENILNSLSEESLQKAVQEVKRILHMISNLLNERDVSFDYRQTPASCSNGSTTLDSDMTAQHPCGQLNNNAHPTSSSVQYSCSATDHSNQPPMSLRKRSESFSEYMCKDSSHSVSDAVEHYTPKLVRTMHLRRFDYKLRTLHELCVTGAQKGIHHLRAVHKYFAKDLATLKLERRDSEVLFPNKGLLTIGRNVQLNFIPDGRANGMTTSKSAHSDIFSDETASFASADSFLSCEDYLKPTVILSSSLDDVRLADSSSLNDSSTACDTNSLVTVAFEGGKYTEANDVHITNKTSNLADSTTNSTTGSTTDSLDSNGADEYTASLAPGPVGSNGCEDLISQPAKVFCFADQLYSVNTSTAGCGLLKFMQCYGFSQHVLFSLLCGRPVVVIARPNQQETAKSLVNTLSFFLTSPAAVEYNRTTQLHRSPLTLAALKSKLVGVVKSSRKLDVLPKHGEQNCSVLDLDGKVFSGPCYLGGVLTEVYSRRKVHSTDATYLAYIHVILQEMAMKAFVFYHTFIQNVAAKLPHMYSKHDEAKLAYRKAEQHFLSRMKVSAHDTEIVKYLAEVMQKQIDGECLDLSDISTSTMDKIPCQSFKQ